MNDSVYRKQIELETCPRGLSLLNDLIAKQAQLDAALKIAGKLDDTNRDFACDFRDIDSIIAQRGTRIALTQVDVIRQQAQDAVDDARSRYRIYLREQGRLLVNLELNPPRQSTEMTVETPR